VIAKPARGTEATTTHGVAEAAVGAVAPGAKVMSMREAIAAFVHDGDTVVIEGFTHLICFAAGHEIIRQRRRDLTLCRLTPDLIYDQMIAAGCAKKLVFSWAGNPGGGSLHAFRRAVERTQRPAADTGASGDATGSGGADQAERRLEIEEYSHFGMVARFAAGAARLPFWPLRDYAGTDLPTANPRIASVACPYTGERLATVPALNPDVAIIHAQRADSDGDTQIWGLLGVQREAAFAARHVIVVVEELVDEHVIRSDPNRTIIPGFIVDAVVVEPWGAHPSYAQGYYDRDNAFYNGWEAISRDPARLSAYLDRFVFGVADRAAYLAAQPGLTTTLRVTDRICAGVNYGY
jgi:glutaconate CoA-transferase, subunit A